MIYRAPVAGVYRLSVAPENGEVTLFDGTRWRKKGIVASISTVPRSVPWPAGAEATVAPANESIDVRDRPGLGLHVECEPNDTPE